MHSWKRPCASSSRDRIGLQGLDLVPDLSGALHLPDYRTLLVADLHLEKGSSFARRGVHLPPYDTRATLKLLESVVDRYAPERLVALGDSFHDGDGPSRLDVSDLDILRRLASRTEIVWLAGNHDPEPPQGLPGICATELCLGPLTLRHEPVPDAVGEIAGHLHPVAAIVRRGRMLRRRCFAGDDSRLVMPAFGAYTGGLDVGAGAFGRLFAGAFLVWLIGRRALHAFPSRAVLAG